VTNAISTALPSTFPTASSANLTDYYVQGAPQTTDGDANFRPVAVGLKVRYVGSELDRGGTVIPFQYAQAVNGSSVALPTGSADTMILVPDARRTWQGTFFRPMTQDSTRYQVTNYSCFTQGVLGIIVRHTAGNQYPYELEVTGYWECIDRAGSNSAYLTDVTRSDSDIGGFSRIRDWLGQFNVSQVGPTVLNAAMKYIIDKGKASALGLAGGLTLNSSPLLLTL